MGREVNGYRAVYGNYGFRYTNNEEKDILDCPMTNDLIIVKTMLNKHEEYLMIH